MNTHLKVLILGVLTLMYNPVNSQEVVGTAFNYQGELIDSGSPANGFYDMNFRLYDEVEGGQVLAFDQVLDIEIMDGLFHVELDFGDAIFMGDARWIEIEVLDVESNKVNHFGNQGDEILSPRQRINNTPYSIQSSFTENVDHPWEIISNGTLRSPGDIEIGSGNGVISDAKVTINSAVDQDPLRVRISGGTKLAVGANGGTSMGTNVLAPENGLNLGGDAIQPSSSRGFVKAATVIGCNVAGIGSDSSVKYFNLINEADFSTTVTGASGYCVVNVPFNLDQVFFSLSAFPVIANTTDSITASCSQISTSQLACKIYEGNGDFAGQGGFLQIMFY